VRLSVRNFDTAHLRIMTNDRLSIRCKPNVEFKPIAAVGQSKIERRDGIFWNCFDGAGATVTEE
jgi:hypothetical protein